MLTKTKIGVLLIAASACYNTAYAATCSGQIAGTDTLSTTDVTFRSQSSDDCAGVYIGQDFNLAGNGSHTAVNTVPALKFGESLNSWAFELKDDSPGKDASTANYLGFSWSLGIDAGNTGNWLLSVTDTNGLTLPNLPVFVDLLVALNTSAESALYFFNDEAFTVLDSSGTGVFNIKFDPNANNIFKEISHMTIFMRPGEDTTTEQSIPEPSQLALLGVGLLGMGLSRKGKRLLV